MSYELHITRAPLWIDSADHPIHRDEWEAFAHNHPDLREEGTIDYADIGTEPVFGHTCRDGTEVSLWWRNSRINIAGAYSKQAPDTLVPIADALNAKLVGDDHESYKRAARSPAHRASFIDRFRRRT